MTKKNNEDKNLERIAQEQIELYKKNKTGIFLEAAVGQCLDDFGVEETKKRLQFYINMLSEF